MQKIDTYLSLNSKSFDNLLSELYKQSDGESMIILSLKDRNYSKKLDCIEEYIVLGKELLNIGNRNRANTYR